MTNTHNTGYAGEKGVKYYNMSLTTIRIKQGCTTQILRRAKNFFLTYPRAKVYMF